MEVFNTRKFRHKLLSIFIVISILLYGMYFHQRVTVEKLWDLEYFENDIPITKVESKLRINSQSTEIDEQSLPLCPDVPPGLLGNLQQDNFFLDHSWSELKDQNLDLTFEGRYVPKECKARYRVAIIIPLRGRESQLRVLLSHMHPIWKRQQIEYQVYTITQSGNDLFNRAKLINVGVAEASRDRPYDCYVFHDVDLLLEDDRCLYWCHKENPRHLAMYMDKFSYELLTYQLKCDPHGHSHSLIKPFEDRPTVPYFGGVSMLSAKQFSDINGFSNMYWGWGGEDDDLYIRLNEKGYSVLNPYDAKCSYRMIPHERESTNAENNARHVLLGHVVETMKVDGYSTLRYQLMSREHMYLYINITVNIGRPSKKLIKFMSQDFTSFYPDMCSLKVPWQ